MKVIVQKNNGKVGESLCLSCGLCCMGVFHSKARVYNNKDREIAINIGARLVHKDNGKWFLLPCPVYTDKCTVYDDRPSVCGKHQCDLLKSVLNHDLQLEQAKKIMFSMKRLLQKLQHQLDTFETRSKTKEINARFSSFFEINSEKKDTSEFKLKHAAMLMNYATFSYLRNRYFYRPEK